MKVVIAIAERRERYAVDALAWLVEHCAIGIGRG
jgi:phage gp46-like protein